MTYRLQVSDLTPLYGFPLITSGAVYAYEPQDVLNIQSLSLKCAENPKSMKRENGKSVT